MHPVRLSLRFSLALAGFSLVLLARSVSTESEAREGSRLLNAFRILYQTESGRSLLKTAQKKWDLPHLADLESKFQWGEVSKTDATLIRTYDADSGKERRDRQVTIVLKRRQKLHDLVLDVAHELTHATSQPSWDPYDPELTAGKYIFQAIEGPGGEVDAVVAECRVSRELERKYGVTPKRCSRYWNEKQGISREKVRRDFYRVGRWHPDLVRQLGSERVLFPLLSQESPELYSSTGQTPYPVSLFREYQDLNEIACDNTRKRVSAGPERSPASATHDAILAKRCH